MTAEQALPWTQPDWLVEAQDWIKDAVARSSSRLAGPVEQPHVRPWGTVLRVPTAHGLLFFKASRREWAFEPSLILAMAARRPQNLPEVVAADTQRGWMLTRDAGTPLRERLTSTGDLWLLDGLLSRLSDIQMDWLSRETELLRLGVLDLRVQTLPARFELLVADRQALTAGGEYALSEEQQARLLAAVPRYAALCERLLQFPVPQSIHFDDMHTSNIFLRQAPDGSTRVTFQDWGDSCVGHPFSSLLIFLRAVADRIGLPDEATATPEGLPTELSRLRDEYLDTWRAFASPRDLLDGFTTAWRVGMVSRALSWQHAIEAMPEPFRDEYRYTVPAWLGEFLLAL